ncbi:MAG TPA: molybdopterin biosynthesis protein MoeB, partial [Xanthomonadales bacterium]|nr:molybdopterin biosynthesis protein MoeB [Xanthomonadales bacterium]
MTRDTPYPAGAHRDTRSAEPVLELPPRAAHERVLAGARLIDIRESGEQATGMAEGAVAVA